ncbi:synaptic vesicle glycoprotein 2B-like isoform X2 [Thrips palmi]|uniref:Synaptic vesicle glycoprotein 2B-like isoform X2 n=1 Tax=Thrips palmi TaxID=161013 RepID=A0A6P8ZZB0_THRPL|nr:synaptic vesicle glycoprotein 2B-like isoform X2 [Thrips palmi]
MLNKVFRIFRGTVHISDIGASPEKAEKQANGKQSQDGTVAESGATTSFEDAVKLTGYGKFNHLLMLVCGLAIMGAIMEMIDIGYVLPAAECDLKLTQKDKGVLGAITYIGIICSAHAWGVLADTTGRRRIMIRALLADVVVSTLACLAPNFWTLVVLRFCNGVCVSAPAALAYAYLGEFNTPPNRNRAIILVGFITACSAIILPGLAWSVLPMQWSLPLYAGMGFRSWRLFILVGAIPALLSGLLLFWFPESPKFLLAVGRREEALAVLRRVYAVNTGKDDFPVRELTEDTSSVMANTTDRSFLALMKIVWEQTAPLFRPPYLLHTFLVCFIQFGNIASASGLLMWLPELFNYQAKYGEIHPGAATICEAVAGVLAAERNASSVLVRATRDVGVVAVSSDVSAVLQEPSCAGGTILTQVYINALIIGVADAIAPVAGSLIVNSVGKRNLLIVCMWVTGVSAIAVNFVGSYEAILALACVVIALTGMCIAHISSIVVDLFPTNYRAMAVSLSLMFGRLGSMVGNFIFGSLLDSYCDAAFYFFGGVLVLNGVFGCLLPKRGRFAN